MRIVRTCIVIAASFGLMGFTAPASGPEPEFLSASEAVEFLHKDSDLMIAIIHALAEGMHWANGDIQAKGSPPLYCPPRKLAINARQHADIFRAYVKKTPYVAKYPAGLVMLEALKATFPCE